jgi:hypothetical protein
LVEVAGITQLSRPVTISELDQLRDPKDKIVLETALGVPVEVIVSGDEDLLILGEFRQIPILTTKQFLENYQFADLVSNTYGWALVINSYSIAIPGFAFVSADEVSEQIRRLLILKLNFLLAKSPTDVEKLCDIKNSVGSELVPSQVIPNFFSNERRNLYQTMNGIGSWINAILLLPRDKYDALLTALTAYERSFYVLSADPALSYALLVFAIEALANNHKEYQASWCDIKGKSGQLLNSLFGDKRISDVDRAWIDEFKSTLVDILHPAATKRFTQFALSHIDNSFFEASQSNSKSPLRQTRLKEGIQNAYDLRSSFAHALVPLNTRLISESRRAEELEHKGHTYITLRGMFRVTRSILLKFIERQTDVHSKAEPEKYLNDWIDKTSAGTVQLFRPPAYTRIKDLNGKFLPFEGEDSKRYLEDMLCIYQENYIEGFHNKLKKNGSDGEMFIGIATSGSHTGRMLFRSDPSPDYDWKVIEKHSLKLIPNANQENIGYLQAIALLSSVLSKIDGKDSSYDGVLKEKRFGTPKREIVRFVVDIINHKTSDWSAEQAGQAVKEHLKNPKVYLPSRVEIACLLQVASLFEEEESSEDKLEWLDIAYGDTASYPKIQNSIGNWRLSQSKVIDPQLILKASSDLHDTD